MREVGKIFSFSAGHRLPSHNGLCKNQHGHNYKLEVRVSGLTNKQETSPSWGMIIDFGDLKKIVKQAVLDFHDHTYLNDRYPNPTAENMVYSIAKTIASKLPSGRKLTMVKLWETEDCYAIWKEDQTF